MRLGLGFQRPQPSSKLLGLAFPSHEGAMLLDRRTLLVAAAASTVAGRSYAEREPERLKLWPGTPPGGGGPTGLQHEKDGMISNIAIPSFEVFAPARPNGAAMLIAAGGGLTGISQAEEAYPAARWLIDQGAMLEIG